MMDVVDRRKTLDIGVESPNLVKQNLLNEIYTHVQVVWKSNSSSARESKSAFNNWGMTWFYKGVPDGYGYIRWVHYNLWCDSKPCQRFRLLTIACFMHSYICRSDELIWSPFVIQLPWLAWKQACKRALLLFCLVRLKLLSVFAWNVYVPIPDYHRPGKIWRRRYLDCLHKNVRKNDILLTPTLRIGHYWTQKIAMNFGKISLCYSNMLQRAGILPLKAQTKLNLTHGTLWSHSV